MKLENVLNSGTPVIFGSTKTYVHSVGLSCCFRQWRADSHCRFMHGYALQVHSEFETTQLDQRNWVVDFGSFKPVKAWLEDQFDHKTLVAEDDPQYYKFVAMEQMGLIQLRTVPAVGCEAFSRMIFQYQEGWLKDNCLDTRVQLTKVQVSEHGGNSAYVRRLDAYR